MYDGNLIIYDLINFLRHYPSLALRNISQQIGDAAEEKVYVKESFVPPEISMINFFLDVSGMVGKGGHGRSRYASTSAVETDANAFQATHYQSDQSDEELLDEDVEEDEEDEDNEDKTSEHMNPKSYSWTLMRYALVKASLQNVNSLLEIIGVDLNELAILSPDAYDVLKSLQRWTNALKLELIAFQSPPDNYMSQYVDSNSFNGPKVLNYYKSLNDPNNTPFR
jgi:hypothetical protein